MGSKVVVDSLVLGCSLVLGGFRTTVDLCILSLGSCDVVLGMEWLDSYQDQIDCWDNRV